MTNSPPEPIANDRLDVSVDRDAEVPVGVQLGWALSAKIRNAAFKPGQRLPTLRDMAEASGLNINTVRAVYQRLEQKGLIESRQGSGTFVASTRHAPSEVALIAANAAREAIATGIDPREVAAALYVSPPSGSAASGAGRAGDDATSRRRALRTQIAVLERAIGEFEATNPGRLPVSTATRPGPGPMLLGVDELESVRTHLLRRLTSVQSAADEHGKTDAATARKPAPRRESGAARKSPGASKRPKRPSQPRATRPAPAGT